MNVALFHSVSPDSQTWVSLLCHHRLWDTDQHECIVLLSGLIALPLFLWTVWLILKLNWPLSSLVVILIWLVAASSIHHHFIPHLMEERHSYLVWLLSSSWIIGMHGFGKVFSLRGKRLSFQYHDYVILQNIYYMIYSQITVHIIIINALHSSTVIQ